MLTNKTIITVFGGTGFLGRHIINQLAKTGATIRVPTRAPASAYFLKPMGFVGQIIPVLCDIHQDDHIQSVIKGSDIVINLIGQLHASGKDSFEAIHHRFPERLASLSKKQKVNRLIHVSAIGVDDQSKCRYLKTKALGEQALLTNFGTATILRPSLIFGPEDNFFNLFAKLIRLAPVLPLIGGGQTIFQPVYAGDIAQTVQNVLDNPDQTQSKTYELGGPTRYSFRDLIDYIMAVTGHQTLLVSLPWIVATLQGFFLQYLPGQLLSPDQVEALKKDNIVSDDALSFADLDIRPTSLETIVPGYLESYKKGGQFS